MNVMTIGGHRAVIQFDPETGMFRSEFLGPNGGADFQADSIAGLQGESEASLRIFLDLCREKDIEPVRRFSGKFQLRVAEELHARAAETAAARGVSLNQLIQRALKAELREGSS